MSDTSPASQLYAKLAEPFPAEEMFDLIPNVVFFVKNRAGCYVSVNQTLVERSGRKSKDELIGCSPSEILGSHLGKGYEEQDQKVLQSGQHLVDELELHVYQNREVGWCLTGKRPLLGKDKEVVGLVGVSRDLKLPDVTSEDFDRISEVVDYAQERIANPPSLQELADVAGMSIYQLDRRMKKLYDLPTGQWLLKIRIDHASRLLLNSDQPIADIAMDCGYGDQSAFTRQFRRTTGQTPSTFRKLREPDA
ncbi:AraC family transcriptional regulator [Pseudoteredinibacter isoporae]|uniref:AraC-like DNA-binding protein n=1 Tax=Pseudoteredinibacter isoporae TaxID=570281 RepID=A0A7X0JUM2_9GAMM|nr:AraC family transcriptional regulator [Pseudoteredinibacter isoporae]MBB6521740.1 AraC-like DNA-binding protein [Pseudoteredinibacter isoporae]NHO87288.1 AraC family transcriptional regulator [Pseudoteredinibacter isoporae]NIB23080.1 AraC family transcriptional regulator [Pseudoteredinibacter isoporae]